MEEEWQLTEDQVDILLEDGPRGDLANVDIEDVCEDGALHDVDDGEDEGPQRDAVEGELIAHCVSGQLCLCGLPPGNAEDALHDQEGVHHQLDGGLHTPRDAV